MGAVDLQHGPVGDDLALVHRQAALVRAGPSPLPGQRAVVLRTRQRLPVQAGLCDNYLYALGSHD